MDRQTETGAERGGQSEIRAAKEWLAMKKKGLRMKGSGEATQLSSMGSDADQGISAVLWQAQTLLCRKECTVGCGEHHDLLSHPTIHLHHCPLRILYPFPSWHCHAL